MPAFMDDIAKLLAPIEGIISYIWIAIFVIAILVEIVSDRLVSIWFVPASIIAVVLDFCGLNALIQCIAFIASALLGVLFSRLILSFFAKRASCKTNLDAVIGQRCVVIEKVDNYAGCGLARIKDQVWSVRSVDDRSIFECGEVIRVVAVEGVKLICKK